MTANGRAGIVLVPNVTEGGPVPKIWIESETEELLKRRAEPLRDTHETVIRRVLKELQEYEHQKEDRAYGRLIAEEDWKQALARKEQLREAEYFWHSELPNLQDTEIRLAQIGLKGNFQSLEGKERTWNGLLKAVLVQVVNAIDAGEIPWLGSVEELREKTNVNVREGLGGPRGWTDLNTREARSYQGQSATAAGRAAMRIAHCADMAVDVEWAWNKEHHEDETRRTGKVQLMSSELKAGEAKAPEKLGWDAGHEVFRHSKVLRCKLNGVRVRGTDGRAPAWADVVGAVAEVAAGGEKNLAAAREAMGMEEGSKYLEPETEGIRYTGKAAKGVRFIGRAFEARTGKLQSLVAWIWWPKEEGSAYPGQTSTLKIGGQGDQ